MSGRRPPQHWDSCDCDYHRMQRTARYTLGDASDEFVAALHFAYWSTHCARCGDGMPFAGHDQMSVCERCDREITQDAAIDAIRWVER